jgi:hypothetical protein
MLYFFPLENILPRKNTDWQRNNMTSTSRVILLSK